MARAKGFEPLSLVLETNVLPLNYARTEKTGGGNRMQPLACKASALPTELYAREPLMMVAESLASCLQGLLSTV